MSHIEDSTQTHSAPQKLENARRKQKENVKRTVEVFESSTPKDKTFPDIDTMNVSSATELTGMMYRPPMNTAEMESYHDLYNIEYEPVAAKQSTKDRAK